MVSVCGASSPSLVANAVKCLVTYPCTSSEENVCVFYGFKKTVAVVTLCVCEYNKANVYGKYGNASKHTRTDYIGKEKWVQEWEK